MKKIIILLAILLNFPHWILQADTGTSPLGPPTMGQPTYPNSGLPISGEEVIKLRTPAVSPDEQRQEETGSMQGFFDRDGKYIYWDPKEKEEEDYE